MSDVRWDSPEQARAARSERRERDARIERELGDYVMAGLEARGGRLEDLAAALKLSPEVLRRKLGRGRGEGRMRAYEYVLMCLALSIPLDPPGGIRSLAGGG